MASIINATTTAGVSVQGDNSGSLQLATNNGTTAVTIDTSQNVGIGTSSPTGKLDVSSGSAGVSAGDLVVDTANKTVYVGRQSSTGGDNGYLVVRGRLNGSGTNQAIAITGDTTPYGTGLFRPNNDMLGFSTLATERMRIDSSGKVLIGSTSLGSANLNSVGSSAVRPQINIYNTDTGSTTQALMEFFRNAVLTGNIQNTGTTTLYNTSSDYRLKENILPMTGALAKVKALKPCTYTWKLNGSTGQGFIAHELQEVITDCVTGEKDAVETYTDEDGNEQTRIKPQGIDTSFLVATLTAAIQELKAELDATKAEVQALKGTL